MASMSRNVDSASDDLAQIWDWNAKVPESVVVGVHSMFEKCAQHQPAALAVDAWDGKLTANFVYLTPTVARQISSDSAPTLETVAFIGEALSPRDLEPWQNKVRFINTYGPSECTTASTINPSTTDIEKSCLIGKGSGMVTWIVDPEDHNVLLPLGARPSLEDVVKSANLIDEEAERVSAQRIEAFSLLGQGLDVESFLKDVAEEYQVDSSLILDAFPCTPLQEGLLSLSSMSSGEYISQNVLELDAQVDIGKFCAAWEKVCVVVDALRTRIVNHRHLGLVQLVMRETIHWLQGTDMKEYLTSDQEQVMGPGSQLSRFALIGDATNGKTYFVWTIHHALYDEWSLSLLLSLASKIYSGSTIAAIPTFQPFIKYIQDQDPSRTALYWEEALNGCECAPFPTLPPSISQPLVDTSVVHQLPHVHRANASGITTATVIRASWALVVASMTNSDDVVFGSTVSGRNVPIADIETVPAPTIATVPVRITLSGSGQLVSELLQTVQSQAIDMVPYEQMGLHRIAKISLDAQQACDFQTLIVIQPEDDRQSKAAFGSWREDLKQQELSTYGLTLEIHLGMDSITANASFDSRMIEPWIVDGLLERLAHVMNQFDDIGEKSIMADIQVITQEDLSRIWAWNKNVPKIANVSIHEILSHKASARPTHTAISAWDGEFSYQEIDHLTTVLAARIYELGLAQGSIIPLYFEKSAWANVAMLAVLKAGCAFVLLDTSLPEQRLLEMIRQVDAEFILCSPSTHKTSLRLASRVLEVNEALLSELTRASLTNSSVSLPLVPPNSLAYVLFTSGSTGRPKCVAITHNNVTSAVPEHVQHLGYTAETRIYDFASYSFGASLNNAFCALVAGGCLCVPSDEDRRSNLAESLSALKATSVLLTPSIAESLSPESVTSLKTLILGGEAVRPKHVKPWWDRARVLTAYGSSEMTTVATINSQASDPDEVTRIGTGAGGVTWVVDPNNHHVLSVPGSIGNPVIAAFLQMDDGDEANAENGEEDRATILTVNSTVENWLAEQLPIYMVPTVFFALRKLPLLSTGKMNRRMLRAIGNSVSMAEIAGVKDGQKVAKRRPGSELEGQIQALWARTLNIEEESIGMDDSFFRLGGDSISAMQVASGARSRMINLRVVDILRLKTISNLAKSVEAAKNSYTVGRTPEVSAGLTRPRPNNSSPQLSPIQNLYFHLQQDATACFDQYFFLKLNWHVEYEDVVTAISSIIRRHDALRARFSKNEAGAWEQSIIHDDGASSLNLLLETENDASQRATIISDVRSSLDIVNGPIVSGVLFDQGQQALFLTIHHLVIDLVSWRIILQELEDLLTHGVAGIASPSLHFPDWIAMQARYAWENLETGNSYSHNSQINASYWGMETNANIRSGAAVLEFTLDEHTSSRILGSCNAPLGTQPLEIMISALIHSFSRIFSDRTLPLVFTEGHGREVWDDDIDLSATVGWFSTIYPVHDLVDARTMSIIDIIRHTKDFIRRMPQNGWSHFTSRFANYKLANDFSKDFPVEVLFNYVGLYQQLERDDGLFQMANIPAGSHPPSNEQVRRFTLFDIDVYVDKGRIHATLEYHQDMRHQEKIVEWVAQFEASLRLFATELPTVPSQLTLSDVPLAFTSHHDLQEFYETSLPQLQLETKDIENIFPCAPLQEGILLSQAKDPLSYQRWFDVQIDVYEGGPPLTRLEIERAWKAVVKRHGLLRALLVGNIPGSTGTMHVILKDPTPEIIWLGNDDEWKMRDFSGYRLQHRVTIIEFSESKALLRIQMNHAITDGFSQDMLCHDLRNELLGQNSAISSSYEGFVRHLSSQSSTDGLEYWKGQLSKVEPCLLSSPETVDYADDGVGISSLCVSGLDTEKIRTFCSEWDVTPATIVKTAWGLVLSLYTDTPVPTFGNMYSGRDIPMYGVDDMFGPLIGMVPCSVRIDHDKTVMDTLKQVQSDYLGGLEYQHSSLAEIHRALGLGCNTLFNTLLSYQRQTEEDQIQIDGLTVRAVDNFDPTEYDVTVDIIDAISKINIELTFRSGHLSDAEQQCLVDCVGTSILSILDGPLKPVGQLSLIGKADLEIIAPSGAHTKSVVAVFIQFGQDGSGSSSTADILSVDPETVANISRRLPRYMVPSVFFKIRSFQKTPSGKINRILLRQIGASFSAQQLAESASLSFGPIRNPVTHVEHRMQDIWARVLNIDPSIISLDGDFFQLGGDSIAAMKLVAEARKVGLGLTVADVFRHPKLEHTAAHAVFGAGSKHLDTTPPFTLLGDQAQAQELLQDVALRLNLDISRIHDAYPATPLQQGLFSLSLKRSGDYVMQSILELYPETDINKFQQAWQKVAETFPILRTRMMQSDDHGLLQIVCDDPPQWNKAIGLDAYLKADRAASMDLGEPLTRYALVQDTETPSKIWFIWTVHHVLYDGWSEPLIASAVDQAYRGITPDPGPQFQTFINNDAKVLGKLREGNQHQWFNTFGLTLVAEIGISIRVKASFDSRVIEPWVVRNLLQQLAIVMEQLDGSEAGRSLKTVSRVSYQDLSTIWEWNKTPTKPANKSISELIRDQSRAQPGSIAVDAWDGSLTYHHLDQLSTNMACYLVKRGLRRGDFVLICTEKSKWATVSILALAKTEAAFVLLDPSLPLQRLKSISRQVQAKMVISSLQYKTLSLQLCQDVLTVSSSLFVKLPTESCEDLPTLDLDSAIYVVFTSGTTGTPKGAVIHHRSSATAVINQVKGFCYNTKTRLYDFSTYSFDGSILNAFTVLYGGGTLCVPTDDGRKSSLAESMESLKANTVFLTPSVANIMSPREVPHLKTMILGGEAIRVEDVQPWWDFVKVFTIYGPTSQATAGGTDIKTIKPTRLQGPVEQSFAQGRLWFLEELYPGLTWYLMPCIMSLRGPLHLEALNVAFRALEQRHETLRTTLSTKNGVNLQHIHPVRGCDLRIVVLSPDDEKTITDHLHRDETTPFDLSKEPGWRVTLYKLGENHHILSIILHHIFSDGWSVDIFRREMAEFYSAAVAGKDPLSLATPLPVQYRDFSLFQREQTQLEHHDRQLEYWVRQLENSQPAELPCDKHRPSTLSGIADLQTFRIQGSLYKSLQAFCKQHEVTPFIALLAAFRATHYRLTGEPDVLIGSPNANRDSADLKDVIGFFVNMQCLRLVVEDETVSFLDLVKRTQSAVTDSFQNQDVPFESLVSRLRKERDLSRHPLVQIVFALHSQRDLGKFTLEGLDAEYIDQSITTRFDLEFHFFHEEDGLRGDLIYSTDLFQPVTMKNTLAIFTKLLEGCLENPETPTALLSLMTEDGLARMNKLDMLEIQKTDYPRDSTIVTEFRKQVLKRSDKIAVKDLSMQLTYRELDNKSDKLANWLQHRHYAPESLVGVLVDRSCFAVVAFIGILKANLAYLPFDLKTPTNRMRSMLSSVPGHKLILVGPGVKLPVIDLPDVEHLGIVEALDQAEQIDTAMDLNCAPNQRQPSSSSLAYVMFTSGSTGNPKGVLVEHGNVLRLCKENAVNGFDTTGMIASISNVAFDAVTWEVYTALLNGGTLVCLDYFTVLDFDAVGSIFRQEDIRAIFITPALLKQYLSRCPSAIASLEMLFIGGDKLDPKDTLVARDLLGQNGKITAVYGPTENTGFSTFYPLPNEDECVNGVAIGRSISNSGAYVMDSQQQLVPIGVVGELVVTGDGVARGYTDAARTAERFIEVEVNGQQVKAYRTGDFVRARPTDGQLDYIRRMDGQVKIRGQRLELGEIEYVLKSHASVNDAAVILHQPKDEQAQLISFATLDEEKIQTQITGLELPPGTDDERQPGDDSDVQKQVKVWEESFETDIYETIGDLRPDQVGRDFVGWISMYDGAEIDKSEMNEWLDDTIATMINGGESGHVLELGSGTGMILFNLINTGLRSYVGLDPSQKAVDFVARSAMKSPELASKVHMYKGTAADLSHLDEPICPDLIVVNSVAQYFPGQQYILNVIKDILALKGSRAKTMFFGDMRSYALYDQFRVTRALHRVGRKPGKNEVRQQMKDMEEMEVEYLVAPAFFTSLPALLPDLVEHVEILPKKMKGTNELSCYRYAAVVHARNTGKSLSIHQVHPSSWVDFQKEELDAISLFEHLRHATASSVVAVGNIPYSKTIFERQVLSSLRCEDEDLANAGHWLLEARQKSEKCPSLDAISLTKIAERAGWQVEISWARQFSQLGGLDAIFHRKQPATTGYARVLFQFPTDHSDLPAGTQLSSQPLRQQVKQRIRGQLHDRLQTSLPPYMIPRVINFLDRLPINENGKVDRRALAQSVQARTATRASLVRQPVSDNERRLQKIWAQVLNIEQHTIGLDDSFFQVGGDSLAAMKLVGEARRSGISINVADIFRRPTLQEMSCFETGSAAQGPSASIPRLETSGPVEQSFAQGRLWFMEQLYPGLTWYLMPFAIRINGDVCVPALSTALHALELRHDTLRTTFASRQDVNIQEVHPFRPKELTIFDVADEEELSDALRQDQTTPIRLGVEAGWRVRLLRLDPSHHVLSIIMHHIISDGWSTDVLQKELTALYSAALNANALELGSDKVLTSTTDALPPLPIQYTDFSIWQRQPEQLAEHRRQLEYWVGQLETSQPAELLCDKPRPKTLSGAAAVVSLMIDGALYKQLEQFCNVNGVTKFVALLTAFRVTHLHLTGSVDATIGTVNANRARSEVKDMIGFFVNMQCLRIPIQDESFSELAKQVHKITVDSFSAQDVPFENLVSSLQRDRDLSRHPLVQLVFAFHSQMDLGDFTLEGLETEPIAVPPTTRFDLEFHLFQQHDGLQGEVLYSTDLFDETTMKNMLSVFRTVLETGLQDPTLPVTSLPLLSDEDFRVLDGMKLIEMDRTDYPRDDNLANLFRRQAAITPKHIAVKDPAGQLTYTELDQKSDRLASWLVQRDLAPETLVGIFSARSCKTVIAMLGIVKAGLAYLPFDLKIPKARMETILSSIEGQKIILYGSNVEQVPVSDRADIELISIDETLSCQTNPVELCTAPTSATGLAYVTFTSGSTGKPKGVMVEHRGVVRLVKESNMMQHLPPRPVMAHVTNTAFDVAGFEIYGALLNGGTLVCIDSVMVLDFRIISDVFKKEVIDAAIFAPALLKQYLAECPAALQNLKAIYVAGDRADVHDLFAARQLIKGPVVNAYGPTENSVISTLYKLQDGEMCVNGVPIGESISNSGAYVLDRSQRLVPLGVVGELVVTGDGIARGYTDPERNTGRFVEITIGTERHRAYRTGDVVRRRPCDGQIEFFGRMDGQVKLRGHRVELGEIEHSLRTHEDVNEAVVVLHKEEGKEDQLNGFVTVRQAASQQQGPGEVDVEGHVDVWEQIFDSETYGGLDKLDASEIGRDFAGWISMYDGNDIDKEEMNEWLNETISTILNGDRPRNVLELGTGSGMVLFNLGDGLDSYIGLEPSIRAVHFTRRAANSLPDLAEKVHIFQGTAADITTLPCPVAPNLVIINSVAQYFPSQDYLQKVIDDCVGLKGVETIIFGDMRSHAMRKEFQASKAMFSLGDTATREEIQSKMAEVERAEQELLVDPGFFSSLAKRMPHLIRHVEILPKKMKAINELSCFRYAAVLHVKSSEPLNVHEVKGSEWIDFGKQRLNRDLLLETLEASSHLPAVAISNIPYSKTITERFVVKALEDGGDQVNWITSARREAQQCPSMDACDLSELAESVGYKVELSWARQFTQRGGIDAIFHHHESPTAQNRTLFRFPTDDQDRPSHLMTSVPLRQQLNQRIQEELFERLKALLPPYMVPSVITILENMPINDNGKVDRRALGERIKAQIKATWATVSEQPRTNTELSMQAIWAKVLNLEAATIGIHDKFFHLGGHSITAMKVVAEARRVGLEVAVADVLVHDTIHTLSLHCSTLEDDAEKEEVLSNVILVDEGARARLLNGVKSLEVGVDVDLHQVEDILPLTSFQEKIILDGKKVGQHANYFHLDLGTNIDVPRLQESCARTMTRFSILRARFLHLEQHYWQVVLRNPDVPFHVIEIEGEEEMDQAFHNFCLKDLSQLRSTDLPLSFVLLKHKIQGLRLIIRLSHCQYDGISFPLIFQSLMESYRGFDLPPEPAFRRYLAYATLQRERSISYWKKILQGSSPTQIEPRILPPVSWRTTPAKRIYRHAEMGLPSLPSKTTSAALVSAAWALLLSRITQRTDVVLGHVVAGRNASLSGLDETVGMCLNIIPIRAKLSSHQSSEDLLLGIQNQFATFGEADSLGFKDIIEHCTEWPAGSSFETVIQHQNIDERPTLEGSGGSEAQVSFFDNSHMVPPSLFIVSYPRAGKRLEIKLFANDHVITEKGANVLLQSLCQVSERLGVSPQEPLESCMEAVDLDGLIHE
ncbi:hypothetical protein N3K66_006119 [Trichothecium roseum]|uniref:Uncharacterized protein n=1 Tax=Trichothecium roseum TaxID=47278 RepID=A0ACC0V192_9HYPO|nr:hypothetical protein N3K66_006119 [Trichothecium roseum]